MSHLSFLNANGGGTVSTGGKKTVVDLTPWQTAQALAPLAVTAEEIEFAHEAERLADHEVDQAFASALRQATIQATHRNLTGEAVSLAQRITQLQQLVAQDQALVRQLGSGSATPSSTSKSKSTISDTESDLDIAKAQLGLDSDELADAQSDLERASGDQRSQIQSELTSHEAAMKKLETESLPNGQIAVLSASRYGTLAGRIHAWNRQITRLHLIEQASRLAQNDVTGLTAEHNALETQANAVPSGAPQDRISKMAAIRDRSALRQLLSIYDDRIQTEQQLVRVYSSWANQVRLQHRILIHLILQSVSLILFILICMILGDAMVRRLTTRPALDRRQIQTLRNVLELAVQVFGALLIVFVIFGAPKQTPTILGLTTAALTIALQDFVLAFFGWFVLMSKKGIRVGDWVEINGVGGEVSELSLLSTTLLETGTDKGYPTGRRISFMNGYAIRGQYFNFSTTGRWTWDEITVAVPADEDTNSAMDRTLAVVQAETEEDTRIAEQEWRRGNRGDGLSNFSAAPSVNLRPAGSGVELVVRYVTRASERWSVRDRLFRQILALPHQARGSMKAPD